MTAERTHRTAAPQLRRNSLGLPELVFQGITHIAPATNIVFTFPIIALKAGPDMPISFLLTTIVCCFIANTVSEFSKYMPSSGGYYSFATRGLGSRSGFMATWSYLIYDIIGPAASTGFLGFLISDTLRTEFGVNIAWWIFAMAAFALIWVLTHYGVQLSVRTTALLGAVEILIMLALAITFLIHPGPGSSYTAPLKPSLSPGHFRGIVAGMVFSVLALSGFEAPAPLAQESRRPDKFIGLAVMLSLVVIGIFYVFTSYASAIGWGTGNMAAFASDANPYYSLGNALWGVGWWFVILAIINSAIGAGLACTNAASRVMYTMGQAGTLPARFGRIHPAHQTPTFAIAVLQVLGIVPVLLVGLLLRPMDIFGFLGTIATLAVIILYAMANMALTSYIRRERPQDFSVWRHAVIPWIGTLALLPVLFVTIYPVPGWPYNITPYLFIAALIVGFVYMYWRESKNPGVLLKGATMLVGRRRDDQGEMVWDTLEGPLLGESD
ncbi:MAG TPA: APC family permease [Candidatus Sulfotelmatobacter sp.]|nr:APC family permease [Candidatus Sulfotelmatobacter sp.]